MNVQGTGECLNSLKGFFVLGVCVLCGDDFNLDWLSLTASYFWRLKDCVVRARYYKDYMLS